jgi:hypothetical protein
MKVTCLFPRSFPAYAFRALRLNPVFQENRFPTLARKSTVAFAKFEGKYGGFVRMKVAWWPKYMKANCGCQGKKEYAISGRIPVVIYEPRK